MRTFLYCEKGFVEKPQWQPNSWINIDGMNVDIYVDHFPYAFIWIVITSICLSGFAFFIFRKIKWF